MHIFNAKAVFCIGLVLRNNILYDDDDLMMMMVMMCGPNYFLFAFGSRSGCEQWRYYYVFIIWTWNKGTNQLFQFLVWLGQNFTWKINMCPFWHRTRSCIIVNYLFIRCEIRAATIETVRWITLTPAEPFDSSGAHFQNTYNGLQSVYLICTASRKIVRACVCVRANGRTYGAAHQIYELRESLNAKHNAMHTK